MKTSHLVIVIGIILAISFGSKFSSFLPEQSISTYVFQNLLGLSLTPDQLKNEQDAIERNRKNVEKYERFTAAVESLKKIENPTKHEQWKLKHNMQMAAHMERYVPKGEVKLLSEMPWYKRANYRVLENIVWIITFFTTFIYFMVTLSKSKGKRLPKKGLASDHQLSSRYVNPYDDKFAEETYWQPMRPGGANFRTHEIEKLSETSLALKNNMSMNAIYILFLAPGLVLFVFGWLEAIAKHGTFSAIWDGTNWTGLIFVVVGLFLKSAFASAYFLFDKSTNALNSDEVNISLDRIKALQVIDEITGGHEGGVYTSYELNAVLDNGDRIHLMDHGDLSAFQEDAEHLAEFLDVPIWQH